MSFWSRLFNRMGAEEGKAEAPAPALEPREHFLQQVEEVLLEDPAVSRMERHPEEFGLIVERAGQTTPLYLQHLFADTRELSPEERLGAIHAFLQVIQHDEVERSPWEEVQPRLLPVLHGACFEDVPGDAAAGTSPELLGRPALPFLSERLVIGTASGPAFARRTHLDEWAVGEEEAFAAAHANLSRHVQEGLALHERTPSPLWRVEPEEGEASARLLHPGFLASFAGRVEGRPIAIAPERGLLLVAGDAHPETVERLCEQAEREFQDSPRALSPALYTVDRQGHVIPYLRRGDDALAQRVRWGHYLLALAGYTEQKAWLDRRLEQTGAGLPVARFVVVRRKADGRPLSYCVWEERFGGLLPEAELLALQPARGEHFLVPWSVVERLAPECLPPHPGTWPPLHRAAGWFEPGVLARLRAFSVTLEHFGRAERR